MDTPEDIRKQKTAEWKEAVRQAMQDECAKCSEHTEECPFYDPDEESWDYEDCNKQRGWY